MHYLDPALVEDVYADKPHAEVRSTVSLLFILADEIPQKSPYLATMNYINVVKLPANAPLPLWNPAPIVEDATPLFEDREVLKENPAARKKLFADPQLRKSVKITPGHIVRFVSSAPVFIADGGRVDLGRFL